MARAYTNAKSGITTTSFIRRYIHKLPEDKLFTTRELLPYGSRCAVDKVLSRMVEEGRIKRWARGVFTLLWAAKPTIEDIARVKAESFGRKIITYGEQVVKDLGLAMHVDTSLEQKNIYCINGRTSSFMVGNKRIYLKQTGPRKMGLVEDRTKDRVEAIVKARIGAIAGAVVKARIEPTIKAKINAAAIDRVGKFIRGLWHLGKEQCDEFAIEIASQTLRNRWERTEVRQLANIMPSWLADKLSRWRFSPAVP